MKAKIAFLVGSLFFVVALLTLPHYGINWDTINHLPRGQAYLHYFLTGKTNYADMPLFFSDWLKPNEWYFQDPTTLQIKTDLPSGVNVTRSYYQIDSLNFEYFMEYDGGGHPPLGGIVSSAINRLLFGKLQIMNDVDSYRVYGILLASLTVGLIFYWMSKEYGLLSGLVSAFTLATYPLFWSESHFNNEKDIPLTAFWTLFMFFFWKGFIKKNWKYLLLSGLFAGFALATKFNILFSVIVIGPWALTYAFSQKNPINYIFGRLKHLRFLVALLAIPVIMCMVLVLTWPYLWADPITRVQSVIGFYKQLGLTADVGKYVGILGINAYPFLWIVYTTFPYVLVLTALGIFTVVRDFKKDTSKLGVLILLWLIVPIGRVVWPGANTYGGVRQLMEYVPALSMLAGLGANSLYSFFKNNNFKKIVTLALIVCSLFSVISLYRIHPNENAYFNSLSGGLSGAKEASFPYWGFSFGAPYREAVVWLNKNAEPNATLVYAYELIPNFPRLWLRPDIQLNNAERSGYLMKGEYALTLTYQSTETRSYYDMYLSQYLVPVYTAEVDGVAIASLWKNDKAHLKQQVNESLVDNVTHEVSKEGILISTPEETKLWRLEVDYIDKNCKPLASGNIEISTDKTKWTKVPGTLPDDWRISALKEQPKDGHFIEPFVGQNAKYIRLNLAPVDTCLKNINAVQVYTLTSKHIEASGKRIETSKITALHYFETGFF